jgi:hypothetical protein
MNSSVVASRPRRDARWLAPADAHARWVRRRVGLAWGLLFLNVLTFYAWTWSGLPLIVPIPHRIGQVITQGALPAALLVALTVNRRMLIRPNVFLCLLSLLAIEAFVAVIGHPSGHVIGTLYRTTRLAGFVGTLWLLTPWWGRRDMLLVRCQLVCTSVALGSVLLGLAISPGRALADGRLSGVLWSMPPTAVADYAAVTIGLMAVLWLGSRASGRVALLVAAVAGSVLLLTHGRTALVGMMAGILVAGLSLFTAKARVRKLLAAAGVVVSIGAITLSGVLTAWLVRGQDTQQLTGLTGRTAVWAAILSTPRNGFQVIFGSGLSDLSFNGVAIDSNWLAAFSDLGLIGVTLSAAMLLFLLADAYFHPRGIERALALFLVTYCLVSSVTETGLSGASAYLLELTLAASLLVPSGGDRSLALPSAGDAPAAWQPVADRSPSAPTVLTGGRNENRAGPQPIPLDRPKWGESGR